jgi:hypothetical protein
VALKPSASARLPGNVKAILRAVRDAAETGSAREFRIDGVRGLVLLVLPSGTATWYLHYDVAVGRTRRRRKLKIGRLDDIALADVIAVAERQRPAIRSGADPVARRQNERHEPTFADLVEERFGKGSPLRPATERDYRHVLAHDVLPTLGALPAKQVTREQIVMVVNKVAARGATAERTRPELSFDPSSPSALTAVSSRAIPQLGCATAMPIIRGRSLRMPSTSESCGRLSKMGGRPWRRPLDSSSALPC